MLGVIIGGVASIGILVFLNKDPIAVQQAREQKKKRELEQAQQQKKMEEERSKVANDPVNIEKRQTKKNQLKEKLFKNLTPQERKALEDYISEKKNEGKTDEQIMKEAGTKAFLFFFLIILVFIFLFVGVAILNGGDLDKILDLFGELKAVANKFLQWNFPRLFDSISPSSGEL